MAVNMKCTRNILFSLGALFSHFCFAFDGLGFSIDIPQSWTKVTEQDDPGSHMRNYSFQGPNDEAFLIAVSQRSIAQSKNLLYKLMLRYTPSEEREAQGLAVVSRETGISALNGNRDMIISFNAKENYTACEVSLFGADRLAIITYALIGKPKDAKAMCVQLTNSLVWKPIQ